MPRAPSDLGGAKAVAGAVEDGPGGTDFGTALHLLLEHLPDSPPAQWADIAHSNLPAELADAALSNARAVLANPALAHVFGPDSRAEVPLSAFVPDLGDHIMGAVDRLIVTPTTVTAVDFKSNRTVPPAPQNVPEGILRQMGAYDGALRKIFPDRVVETAILWTRPGNPDAAAITTCCRCTGTCRDILTPAHGLHTFVANSNSSGEFQWRQSL